MINIYSDPDAAGLATGVDWANAFLSVNAGVQSLPLSLLDDYTIWYRSSLGSEDAVLIVAFIDTTNGFKVYIRPQEGQEALKDSYDITRYRNTGGIDVQTDGFEIEGIQFDSQIAISSTNTGNVIFTGCREYSTETIGLVQGASVNATFATTLNNCIVNGSTPHYDNVVIAGGVFKAHNSIFYGATSDGVEFEVGAVGELVNCAVDGDSTDYDIDAGATVTVDYGMSNTGEGYGTNQKFPNNGNWAEVFADPENGDFTAIQGSNLANGIGPLTNSDVPTTDIEDDPRSGTTAYIGVDEPGSGMVIPVVMNIFKQMR